MTTTPIFDGHNDVLLRLWLKKSPTAVRDFLDGDGEGHVDLPRLRKGGLAGGLYAIFPPPDVTDFPDDDDLNKPLAGQLSRRSAIASTEAMAVLLEQIAAQSDGAVTLCTSVKQIHAAMAAGSQAVVMHIEGAEAIPADLEGLDALYARGLRSIGPVWSRPNIFGNGVPFRFPSSPDTGEGLTDVGRALIRACNRLRIQIDLSHLNLKGFWDVADITNAPLVASHSNVHAIAASSRNLIDDQIRAIGQSHGLIGLNYAVGFLREDGRWRLDTPPDIMIRHLDYLVKLAGEDCVGLGSDFDGARIPAFIRDVAGSQALVIEMEKAGFGQELIEKICYRNWLRVLQRGWGE